MNALALSSTLITRAKRVRERRRVKKSSGDGAGRPI